MTIKQQVLEHLQHGGKTASQIKDEIGCDYPQLLPLLSALTEQGEIKATWSSNELPCRIYSKPNRFSFFS